MYAFNITDDIDRLEANHDLVVAAGGTCVMVCINMVGLAGLDVRRAVARRCRSTATARCSARSAARDAGRASAFRAWQKLARLCGADHLHTNGISNKFYESDAEVLASIAAVRAPLARARRRRCRCSRRASGPASRTPPTPRSGTTDLLVLAGGGIHGHPDGAAAGVASMRAAWDVGGARRDRRRGPRRDRRRSAARRSGSGRSVTEPVRPIRARSTATTSPGASTRCCSSPAAGWRGRLFVGAPRAGGARSGGRGVRRRRHRRHRAVAADRTRSTPRYARRSRRCARCDPQHRAVQGLLDRRLVAHDRQPRTGDRDRSRRSSATARCRCSSPSRTSVATRCSAITSRPRAASSTGSTASRRCRRIRPPR